MGFDFALISANNGWAMAVTGAIIVMIGLSLLSLVISQLHKIIAFFDNRIQPSAPSRAQQPPVPEFPPHSDLEAFASLYKALSAELGQSFELAKLHSLANRDRLPHPHLTIRSLREAGYLIPAGEGFFTWKN